MSAMSCRNLQRSLFVGFNNIKKIDGSVFSRMNNLQIVFLSSNECINEDFFTETKLTDLVRIVDEKCKFFVKCGRTFETKDLNLRIIGGKTTKRGQYPFMAALHLIKNGTFFCAGSLISSKHVLSGLELLFEFELEPNLKPFSSCSLHPRAKPGCQTFS